VRVPVTVTELVNQETATLFFDTNGDLQVIRVSGRLVDRVVNDLTGKAVTLNVSGPVEVTDITAESDNVDLLGRSILHLAASDTAPQGLPVPGLYLTSGGVRFSERF
jgi:hypothetical protein